MEALAMVSCQLLKFFFRTSFDAHPDVEVVMSCQVRGVRRIVPDEDAVGLQDEEERIRNQRENLQKMFPCQGGLISADTKLLEAFFLSNADEPVGDLLRRVEFSGVFRSRDDSVRPAEDAAQAASHAVGRGNATIEGCRPEAIVLALVAFGDNFTNVFGFGDGIEHRYLNADV